MQLLSYAGYALWMARLLADSDKPVARPALVERLGIDEGFVQQIMRRLQAADLVQSTRGFYGGYSLAKPAKSITLRQVIEAAGEREVFRAEPGDPPLLAKARKLIQARLAPCLERSILDWPLPSKTASKA